MPLENDPVHAFLPYPAAPVPHAPDGPLAGLTLGVKDIFDVAGYPTGCGQPTTLALSGIKSATAPMVQRLLDAGAAFVGKTHTVELAYALDGRNLHFGTPINPAAPERIPGGSSSGSASATAARLVDIGLGSDTGGSVRGPASYCGLYGIRPTHDRLPLQRCMPLAPSFDTPGWFARDARTFGRVADAVLGHDSSPLPETPRLLRAGDAFALAEPEVQRLFEPVLQRIDRMLAPLSAVQVVPGPGYDALYWAFRRLQSHEAWATHGAFIERYRPALAPWIAERFAYGRGVSAREVEESAQVREAFRAAFAELIGSDGVLVLPTVPDVAPLLASNEQQLEASRARSLRLLSLSGMAGFPQVTVPALVREGAPIGLSVIGPAGSDLSLVRLAISLAKAAEMKVA
jgi:amidase